ncbi:hypothetical protein [Arthrobacter bambusae]|uniref:hypothetical protein n=1 Tax=Arthrobacter bambusae TaxID=1338426 RepID=UPI0027898E6C|nr:hypothetical protein [Arthrobacter bambusae]MDQ0030903.1 hypothetical protein [Arthrobacter bambusae]MDQ0099268.1 hypothetical protein [Arthrobacter bambusae]
MRIIDHVENGTARSLSSAKDLQLRGYDQDELGDVVRDAAALWERSLKSSDPSWAGKSLYEVLNVLHDAGWAAGAYELHQIRRSANKDKHAADPFHDVDALISTLERILAELGSLGSCVPGVLSEISPRMRVRRIVCAVYDFFHAGETVYDFLEAGPEDTWQTARPIDGFQVENKHSREIEAKLSLLPRWSINPPELSDLRTSLLESDSELWLIASFEASYQQLHDILAPYQHDLPLLGGLHREDDDFNFHASVAQSILAGALPDLLGRSRLDEQHARTQLQALLAMVPERLKPLRLDRCSPSTFKSEFSRAIAADSRMGALVTNRGVLLILAR